HIHHRSLAPTPASRQSDLAAGKSSEGGPVPGRGPPAQEPPKTTRGHTEHKSGGVDARKTDIHHPPPTHTFGASDADSACRTGTRAPAAVCRKGRSKPTGMQRTRSSACAQSRG